MSCLPALLAEERKQSKDGSSGQYLCADALVRVLALFSEKFELGAIPNYALSASDKTK